MTKRKMTPAVLWLLTIAWTAVLFGFSGQDAQESADLSMQLTRFVMNLFPALPCSFDTLHFIIRKCAHFGIFAVEGALLGASLMRSHVRYAPAIAAPVCAVIAALNEYHQSFAEGRVPTAADVGIDFAGAVVGIAFAALIARLLRRRNAKLS